MVLTSQKIIGGLLAGVLSLMALALAPAPASALQCDGVRVGTAATKQIGMFADRDCRKFFVDALPAALKASVSHEHGSETSPSAVNRPSANIRSGASTADAFKLHSRPTSTNIIYLDMDGHTWPAGTWWDGYYANNIGPLEGRFSPGLDRDGNPLNFTEAELRDVIEIWEAVAEDFAVFDIDVTTELPTGDRATAFATRGSHALLLSDKGLQENCGCGGIAYLDVFNGSDPFMRPALNFMAFGDFLTTNFDAAEIIAHEVGHNLGLYHDGTSQVEYYGGQAMWTPIMGAGRGAGIATWSSGGYPDAVTRGSQAFLDDFATIARYGELLADAEGSRLAAAMNLGTVSARYTYKGLINNEDDIDWFKFTVPAGGGGNWRIDVDSNGYAPNLDPELKVYNSVPTLLATSNPIVVKPQYFWGALTEGLDASTTLNLAPGTYYAVIDGVGQGSMSGATGYSDYASVGTYSLTLTPPKPAIDSLSTLSGGPGTAVVVSGANLASITTVKFGAITASRFTVIEGNQLLVGVPAGAGVGFVTLIDSDGTSYQSAQQFDARGAAVVPVISSYSANPLPLNEWMTVTGTYLGAATSVSLAGSPVEFMPLTANSLKLRAALGQRGGALQISSAGGSAVSAGPLQLVAPPQIDGISATSAYAGELVTIHGGNLQSTTRVTHAGAEVSFTVDSDTSVTFVAPQSLGSAPLVVETPSGTAQSVATFTVLSRAPIVESQSATRGLPGTVVTLTGQHLQTTSAVTLNGLSATFQVVSDTALSVRVPTGATTGKLQVTTDFGQWTSEVDFTVLVPRPVITSFTPARAKAGVVITINGQNFNGAISVWFGGVKATKVQRVSASRLRVTVPPSAKTGFIQVKANGGTVTSKAKFTRLR